jgi:hypothetical protein
MDDNSNKVERLLGGFYVAITSALSREEARVADDVLLGLAADPRIRPDDRLTYQHIAMCASGDTEH